MLSTSYKSHEIYRQVTSLLLMNKNGTVTSKFLNRTKKKKIANNRNTLITVASLNADCTVSN